jgi:hypothetical protein
LIIPREQDGDQRQLKGSWYHRFDRHDFAEHEFLSSFGGEAGFTTNYNVDSLGDILEIATPRLVILVIVRLVLALLLGVVSKHRSFDGLVEVEALPCRVLALQVPWALPVQELFKLLLRVSRLLASRVAVDIHDEIVWLALSAGSRVVLLALVIAAVVASLVIVVVVVTAVLRVAIMLLILLACPLLHVRYFNDCE